VNKLLRNTRWALIWGGLICILSAIPGNVFPVLPGYFDLLRPDKLIHLGEFTVFFILLYRGFSKPGTPRWIAGNIGTTSFLLVILLGAFTELMQMYLIPKRFGSPADFIADLAGALLGWGAIWLTKRFTAT